MSDAQMDIKDLDSLIAVLQEYRQQYGNIAVGIDLSTAKQEGFYDIDAVLYGTDEDDNSFIDLILW